MPHVRALLVVALLAFAGLSASAPTASGQSAGDLEFADWTGVSGNVAAGSLRGSSISLSGSHVSDPPASTVDGSSTVFAEPFFSPQLAMSDALEFRGDTGFAYTLEFGSPARDPVLHLGSLASTLEFPEGTQITKVSGESTLTVSENTVTGAVDNNPPTDANGTVQLTGTFDSVSFSATPVYPPGPADGIYLQVGALEPSPPPPPPPPPPGEPISLPGARNLTRPQISFLDRQGTSARYQCSQGSWDGLAADPGFAFAWWRLSERLFRDPATGILAPRHELAGAGPTFTLPSADVGKRFYCEVLARGQNGLVAAAFSPAIALTGRGEFDGPRPIDVSLREYGDVRIRGIDVFQLTQPAGNAVQFGFDGFPADRFPSYCGNGTPTSYMPVPFDGISVCELGGRDPQRTRYAGVALDQRKPTTAVVYVDMNGTLPADPALPLEVRLSARLGERPLSGSPSLERKADPRRSRTDVVTADERANVNYGVQFDVPANWLGAAAASDEPLSLEASVSLPPGAGAGAGLFTECLGDALARCTANNRFRVDDLPVFDDLPILTIKSIALANGNQALTDPGPVMQRAVELFPGGERLDIQPYSGNLDINPSVTRLASDPVCMGSTLRACRSAGVNRQLDAWAAQDARNTQGYNILLGIHDYAGEPGWARGTTIADGVPTMTVNDGSLNRPITAAAHEYGHVIALPHAHSIATEPVDMLGCGGGIQPGPPWPSDNAGRLQGVAWHREGGTETPVVDVSAPGETQFDLMSYCAPAISEVLGDPGNPRAWISPFNWNRTFKALRDFRAGTAARARARRAQAAQAGQAFASGVVGPAGARVLRVVAADPDNLPSPPDPSSSLRLRALDAAGATLAETGVLISTLTEVPDAGTFTAAVPADAAAVELLSGGAVVHRLERSRPPTVDLNAPRRNTPVGRSLELRWRSSDPDGGDLTATIEYSPDGGRNYQNVSEAPDGGRATVPASFLAGSNRGRVRVTISDGFNEARAESALFRVAGTPPRPRIQVPAPSQTLQAGRVLLQGAAFDDRQRRLRGRSLTWFAGRRRLGRGEELTARLRPGRVRLRLVARDRSGRTGTAVRRLRVTPVPLELRALDVPARVRTTARRVAVRIATSVPATLRAGGRSYAVRRRARTVRIRLPASPRTGLLSVPVTIRARGARRPALRTTLLVLRI